MSHHQTVINLPTSILPKLYVPKGKTDVSTHTHSTEHRCYKTSIHTHTYISTCMVCRCCSQSCHAAVSCSQMHAALVTAHTALSTRTRGIEVMCSSVLGLKAGKEQPHTEWHVTCSGQTTGQGTSTGLLAWAWCCHNNLSTRTPAAAQISLPALRWSVHCIIAYSY